MSISPLTLNGGMPMANKAAELSAPERAKASSLKGASLRNATPAQQGAAVAAQFEAILVRQLIGKTMSSMAGGQGSAAGSVYGDMLADTISQQLTAGQGLGLGRMLERQLTPRVSAAAPVVSVQPEASKS